MRNCIWREIERVLDKCICNFISLCVSLCFYNKISLACTITITVYHELGAVMYIGEAFACLHFGAPRCVDTCS